MPEMPKVETIERTADSTRFQLVGGTLAEGWAARPGREAWCEIVVHHRSGERPWVGSYGGEVWPTAWPELFEAIPSSAAGGSGGVRITDQGIALLVPNATGPQRCLCGRIAMTTFEGRAFCMLCVPAEARA